MLKNHNDNYLISSKDYEVHEKYCLFFQIWTELLNVKTSSPYRHKLMNTLSCLKEIQSVLELRLNNISLSDNDTITCSEEAAYIFSKDIVLRTCDDYRSYFNILQSNIHISVSHDYQKRARLYLVQSMFNKLEPDYMKNIFDKLEDAIKSGDKTKVITCAEILASYCTYKGWSRRALYSSVNLLKHSQSDSACVEKWNNFKTKLMSEAEEYTAFFNVNALLHENPAHREIHLENLEEVQSMGIFIKNGADLCAQFSNSEAYFKNNDSLKYMQISVKAFDIYSASVEAIQKISRVLNLLSFYDRIEAWNIRNTQWVIFDNNSQKFRLVSDDDIFITYDYAPIKRQSKVYTSAKRIINSEDEITRRLLSVLTYANMANCSYSFEERFINFWFALESFCRSDAHENIISGIIALVPNALCVRYIHNLFYNFIKDCERCEINITPFIGSNNKREKQVENIIQVLKDDKKFSQLENLCGANTLLKIRCQDMHKIAVDEREMIQEVEAYHKKIEHNLSRLYRLRNGLVHNAAITDSNHISFCTEHLEEYLKVLVDIVILYMSENQGLDIKSIFEMVKGNYKIFCDLADMSKNKKTRNLLYDQGKDFFNKGIMRFI